MAQVVAIRSGLADVRNRREPRVGDRREHRMASR